MKGIKRSIKHNQKTDYPGCSLFAKIFWDNSFLYYWLCNWKTKQSCIQI